MARIASRRPLPKERALHANVVGNAADRRSGLHACRKCGFTICDCARRAELAQKREYIESAGRKKKPDRDAAAKAFLRDAQALGASVGKGAVKSAIDKTLEQEQHEAQRRTRAELQKAFDALAPELKKNLNVMVARAIVDQNVTRVRMLEACNGFHQNEHVNVVEVLETASGLVCVENHGAIRRGLVRAAAVTW